MKNTNLFFDEMANLLDIQGIRYARNVAFNGRSGNVREFDFLIPASSKWPERIINIIGYDHKKTYEQTINYWKDIKNRRPSPIELYVFIIDNWVYPIDNSAIKKLKSSKITPKYWVERKKFIEELK